jgi:hypothetical protein
MLTSASAAAEASAAASAIRVLFNVFMAMSPVVALGSGKTVGK